MLNIFKKKSDQKKDSQWKEILKSRILPEEKYYYSVTNTFNEQLIKEEINQTYRPDLSVNDYLTTGLYLNYANFNNKISRAYLEVALHIANKILELPQSETQRWNDDKLFTDLFKSSILIDKLFLDALLTNENVNTIILSKLNVDLLEYLKTYKGSLWEDVTQSTYLSSVWNLMVAGDFKQARNYLNVKKKFPYVRNLYEWTKQINDLLIAKNSGEENTHQLKEEFDAVFNAIRQAYWGTDKQNEAYKLSMTLNSDYVRLQLAIIRWLYIEQQTLKGNWEQVLAQVSN